MEQISDIETDIADLEASIVLLQSQKQTLTAQLNRPSTLDYFDELIAPLMTPGPVPSGKNQVDDVLYEAFFRLAGLTAFPISSDTIGIRFDIFSIPTHQYNVPYYIILRWTKDSKTSAEQWQVYKSTVPNHVPVSTYAKNLLSTTHLVVQFAGEVRQYLITIEYNHQKFQRVADSLNVQVTRDIGCQEVKLGKRCRLLCSSHSIEVVECGDPRVRAALVNTAINHLAKNIRPVRDYFD